MSHASPPDAARIESAILALAGARGGNGSISPSDVAQALAPEGWRPLLGAVRRAAAGLAAAGRIDILRKGKPVDASELRGVVRLRIRHADAATADTAAAGTDPGGAA